MNKLPNREPTFSPDELRLIRQWFGAVEDLSHPEYLKDDDYVLADKVADLLGIKRPSRMRQHRTPPAKGEARE